MKLSVYYQRGTELKNTLTKDHIIEGFESQLVETDDLYLDKMRNHTIFEQENDTIKIVLEKLVFSKVPKNNWNWGRSSQIIQNTLNAN